MEEPLNISLDAGVAGATIKTPGIVSRERLSVERLTTTILPFYGEQLWVVGIPRPEYAIRLADRNEHHSVTLEGGRGTTRYIWKEVRLNEHTVL